MNLFYHPEAESGSVITLDASESAHLVKSLRKRSGDQIELTDGKGNLFDAVIEIGKKETNATIGVKRSFAPRAFSLELAIAPTKNNERLEWFVEKAVEIGIEKITLIHCEHSERPHINADRLVRVAVAAMKQSLKCFLPEISPLIPARKWFTETAAQEKFIAHCNEVPERVLLRDVIKASASVVIAIGPEGDFSKVEIAEAMRCDFIGVSLGTSRLRTETAALAAVHTFALINQ